MKRFSARVFLYGGFILAIFSLFACSVSSSAGPQSMPRAPSPAVFVFVSSLHDQFDIYLGDSDGNLLKQLTNTPEREQNTIFSPDGSRIAFCVSRSDKSELYVMNADGSGQQLLTDKIANLGCFPGLQIAWSPDSKWISLYVSTRHITQPLYDLFAVSSDGAQAFNLTASPGSTFGYAWEPDSQSILVAMRPDGKPDIFRINLKTRKAAPLASQPIAGRPAGVSPDGRLFLYSDINLDNSHIYSIPENGGRPTQLTDSLGSDTYPAWSADGRRIIFTSSRDGNDEIYIMNADGSGQTNLTNNPEVTDTYPSMSPAGDKIIYLTNADKQWDSWVMNTDGSGKKKLTDVFKIPASISWRP